MQLSRFAIVLLALAVSALLFPQTLAAQTQNSDPQALSLAAQSMQALNHGVAVSDVTLTGTATQTAGSWSSTGAATFKALGAAQGYAKARADFSASGHSEIRTLDTSGHPIGAWVRSSVQHSMAVHNTFTDAAWFFPALTLLGAVSQQGVVARYICAETHNGVAVKHVRFWRTADSTQSGIANVVPRLSTVDIYLDSTSSLPVALAFNAHSDRDMNTDVAVEVRYSDYRQVNGVSLPFHVQKYLNNGLLVDFQASQATINSGLSDTQFSVQ